MGRKKRNGIKLFLLIFLIVLLLAVSAAMVIYGLLAGDKLTVGILVPLIVVTIISLARHIATSFGSAFFRGADFRLIAMIFGVMFLILFTAAVIYYYLISDHTLKPEAPSEMEPNVIEQPIVEEEIIPELEEVVEPVIEEEVEQKEMEEIDTLPAVPSLPQVDTYNEVLVPGIPSFSTLVEAELAEPSAPSFEMTISRVLEGTPAIPLFVEEGISRELREIAVPSSPVVSVESSSLYEEWLPPATTEDDDFWADFFIAGEDELVLEDGIYYMGLNINDVPVGTVETIIENGDPKVRLEEVGGFVREYITETAYLRLFSENIEYVPLSFFSERGVESSFDSDTYNIYLYFDVEDMPIQIMRIDSSLSPYNNFRPIEGSVLLDPALFVLSTRYNLGVNATGVDLEKLKNTLSVQLSLSNDFRISDVFGRFGLSFGYYANRFYFSFDSYNMYKDFEDGLYRLTWGNVSHNSLSLSGTSVGIKFEKGRLSSEDKKSKIEKVISIEKKSDVVIYNQDREIFRRTLDVGNYLLRDFILYTGANHIRIEITPLDGSPKIEYEMDVVFSSSMLEPGESTWGISLGTNRKRVSNESPKIDGALRIPYFDNTSIEYDIRNLVISGNFNVGIANNLSLSSSLAFKNEVSQYSLFNMDASSQFEMTHVNKIGTTRYNLSLFDKFNLEKAYLPNVNARISHQVYTDWRPVSSMNFSIGYYGGFCSDQTPIQSMNLSSSFGGSLGIFGWGLSLYSNINFNDLSSSTWSLSPSASIPLGNHVSFSCGMSFSAVGDKSPSVSGSVSMSVRFGKVGMNASTNVKSTSFNANASFGSHSLSARANITDWTDINKLSASGYYGYTGNYISMNTSVGTNGGLDNLSYAFNMTSSSIFADGLFSFVSYIPNNFILFKQEGRTKSNTLSIGTVGSSYSTPVKTMFGVGLYSGISRDYPSSLSVYSIDEDSFGGALNYNVAIPASPLSGYTYIIRPEEKYTYSGVIEFEDDFVWANGSSPIYEVIEDEDGGITLNTTENYVFSDDTGRFILSEMEPGSYAFDLNYKDSWILVRFEIEADEDRMDGVNLLIPGVYEPYTDMDSIYSGTFQLEYGGNMTVDAFWEMLYPTTEEVL